MIENAILAKNKLSTIGGNFVMFSSYKKHFCFYGLFLFVFILGGFDALAQEKDKEYKYKNKTYSKEFCSDNWNWSDNGRVSAKDLREITLSGGSLTVDGKKNGGISVKGENRSDILVRACVQTWAATESEANNLAKSLRIETSGTVRAEGLEDEKNWGVSYQILVPRNTNLKLTAHNGGISISDVEGTLEFETKNGGLHLSNLAGDVHGRTTNGGVHIELAGNSWKGNGLDVETTNGGVHLSMSENYAARIETGTVNGGFKSDIPGLTIEKDPNEKGYYNTKKRISTDLNGGGATVRVVTTNGGVKIASK
jgi:hypothetical protein